MTDSQQQQALVKELHLLKTDLFMKMVEDGMMPLRPGVKRLVSAVPPYATNLMPFAAQIKPARPYTALRQPLVRTRSFALLLHRWRSQARVPVVLCSTPMTAFVIVLMLQSGVTSFSEGKQPMHL